ncbi:MAG TPA: hypothetical protein VG265_07030 [Gaiellaceae bacterium]|jgi:hypothetical protein|nr:hypothetical protein [Gaiellaceae bacterium]
MALVGEWERAEAELPSGWVHARVLVRLEEAAKVDRVTSLLAPLQPLRAGEGLVAVRVSQQGDGPSPESLRRALARLDAERLHGTLSVDDVEAGAAPAAKATGRETTLAESWDAALAALPSDWSDLLGQIELYSSDYLEPATVKLAPINPRLAGEAVRLQFRSASSFGFGASPGMVRRCLERCDAAGIRGNVEILRALSDTQPVATQGPVWQIDGRFV